MNELLQNAEVLRLLSMGKDGLLFAIWETCYVTVISTLAAYVIGLPLGVLMVVGEENGVLPLPVRLLTKSHPSSAPYAARIRFPASQATSAAC